MTMTLLIIKIIRDSQDQRELNMCFVVHLNLYIFIGCSISKLIFTCKKQYKKIKIGIVVCFLMEAFQELMQQTVI